MNPGVCTDFHRGGGERAHHVVIHGSGEEIADAHCEIEERHDEALHAERSLGVSELEAGDRDEYFAAGENRVGQHLPPDAHDMPALNTVFDPRDYQE